jgi:hypothetical protein
LAWDLTRDGIAELCSMFVRKAEVSAVDSPRSLGGLSIASSTGAVA